MRSQSQRKRREWYENVSCDVLRFLFLFVHYVKVNGDRELSCDPVGERIKELELSQTSCRSAHGSILGSAMIKSSPFLYPFVIEYVLIGGSVLFLMWRHVEKM